MSVDVTEQYRADSERVRGIERAGRNAARRGLWGLVELRADELWALRDRGHDLTDAFIGVADGLGVGVAGAVLVPDFVGLPEIHKSDINVVVLQSFSGLVSDKAIADGISAGLSARRPRRRVLGVRTKDRPVLL